MSCKGIERNSGSCAYTSTEACFQSKCRFGTVQEILLGIILKTKNFIFFGAPQSHLNSAVARRRWDWRGINLSLSWNTLPLDQLTYMGMLSPCLPKPKVLWRYFFSVVKAEGINRFFCGGEVLSHTLGQLIKLQKACQYHVRFVCITCKKKTNTGYLSNTGRNPELYIWGRGKNCSGRNL